MFQVKERPSVLCDFDWFSLLQDSDDAKYLLRIRKLREKLMEEKFIEQTCI